MNFKAIKMTSNIGEYNEELLAACLYANYTLGCNGIFKRDLHFEILSHKFAKKKRIKEDLVFCSHMMNCTLLLKIIEIGGLYHVFSIQSICSDIRFWVKYIYLQP